MSNIKKTAVALVAFLAMWGCDEASMRAHNNQKSFEQERQLAELAAEKATAENQKAAAESQKLQLKVQEEMQSHVYDLQIKVANACLSKGGTPVFNGGNVGCQK